MELLNVVLVGAGSIARTHASCYSQIEGVRLSAVVDPDVSAAQSLAGGAPAFPTFEAALHEIPCDVVDVCSPTPTHAQIAIQAIEAGKHLLLEKPMARTLGQCDAIIRAAAEANTTAMVAHVVRFFPEFAQAKAAIDSGAVGTPAMVRTSRGGSFPRAEGSWYADFEQSGGAVLDLIIHDFDWLMWCFGRPKRVYARGLAGSGGPYQDYALVTLRFENGVIAHVEGTWMRPAGFETKFEVAGDSGLIQYSSRDSAPLRLSFAGGIGQRHTMEYPESPVAQSPYLLEIQHFLDCVRTGTSPSVTLQEARAAVAVAIAALNSINTGEPVELTEALP